MERRRIQDPEGYRVYGEGCWGLLGGQFFNGWSQSLHVVKPFKIPDSWIRFRCMDWGSYRPYACLWGAVDYDGNIYFYRELYGYGGKPNVGTKESSRVVAQKIVSAEAHEKRLIAYGVLDNACWNKVDTGAPSVSEEINSVLMANGCMPFNPCVKGREQAAEEIKLRLEGYIDESGHQKPALFVFENCFHTIRTLPELTHDKNKPETYDTNGEDHCLIKGTRIITERGEIPIEEVTTADKVLTRKGYRCVEKSALTQKEANVKKVVFSNGASIAGTDQHPVYVKGKGFVYIKDLRGGDEVLCAKQKLSYLMELHSEDTPIHQECPIGDILGQTGVSASKESTTCIEKFGSFITGKFPKVTTFTTKMGIFLTTILQTLKQSPKANINLNIPKVLQTKSVWQKWLTNTDTLQKNGTLPKQEESGTPNTENKSQQNNVKSKLRSYALSAEKNMRSLNPMPTKATTVLRSVLQGQDGKVELMTPKEPALYAEKHLLSTNTAKSNVAAESAVFVLAVVPAGKADVYNLTVADIPEYFANGVLVHNCTDAIGYGCMSRPYKPERPKKKDAWERDRWVDKPRQSSWGV